MSDDVYILHVRNQAVEEDSFKHPVEGRANFYEIFQMLSRLVVSCCQKKKGKPASRRKYKSFHKIKLIDKIFSNREKNRFSEFLRVPEGISLNCEIIYNRKVILNSHLEF